jgi:Flp pilus assembly protein TadG
MKKNALIRDQRGQTMAEFAIVLPILALLLFGILQFGILFNNYLTLTDAVRSGAREAAVARLSPDPTGTATTAVRTSAADLNQSNLAITVSSAWSAGSDVTVTATYPYSINLLGVVVSAGSLTSKTTERVE